MQLFARPQWWLVLISVAVTGCASWRTVSVEVKHERTGRPLPGAFVYTGYVPKPFSLTARRQDQGYTDANGRVLLRGNFLRYEPTLFGISGDDFVPVFSLQESPGRILGLYLSAEAEDRVFARNSRRPPTVPDLTIELPKAPPSGLPPTKWPDAPSFSQQLVMDLQDAWTFLSRPFRPALVCGYEGK